MLGWLGRSNISKYRQALLVLRKYLLFFPVNVSSFSLVKGQCIGYAPAVQLHQIVLLSAVNRMKIKSLIRNRAKCFSFYEKRIFNFINIFCVLFCFQYFDYKCLISFDLSGWMVESSTFTNCFTFLRKFIPPIT